MSLAQALAAPSGALVRFHHGTDDTSANDIAQNGVDVARAQSLAGDGDFWATTDESAAEFFAQANPAAGTPALLSFDLQDVDVKALLSANPAHALYHVQLNAIQFLPACFKQLNASMLNIQPRILP